MLVLGLLLACPAPPVPPTALSVPAPAPQISAIPARPGRMAIANRADGTVSIVDVASSTVTDTLSLPAADDAAETMYCVFAPRLGRLFVGDRGNDRVVAFDARTLDVIGEAPTGDGLFHMWMTVDESQMWVVNDTEESLTVFDPASLQVLQTIPIPTDLSDDGGFPHDVVIEQGGDSAFVSIFGLSDGTDVVLRYSLSTFAETGRIDASANSPHVAHSRTNNNLYLTTQGANSVEVFDADTLDLVTTLPVPNAHGVISGWRGNWMYAVNIADGGPDSLYTIDTRTNTLVDLVGVDSPTATPHNVAVSVDGRVLYLTHSDGTGTKVSIYDVIPPDPTPIFRSQIDVGTNPYGICSLF